MRSVFKYATKVWITSIVVPPATFCGLHMSREDTLINPDTVYSLIGGLLSIPNWLLMIAIIQWINLIKKPMLI
jgi:hypothetical protein